VSWNKTKWLTNGSVRLGKRKCLFAWNKDRNCRDGRAISKGEESKSSWDIYVGDNSKGVSGNKAFLTTCTIIRWVNYKNYLKYIYLMSLIIKMIKHINMET